MRADPHLREKALKLHEDEAIQKIHHAVQRRRHLEETLWGLESLDMFTLDGRPLSFKLHKVKTFHRTEDLAVLALEVFFPEVPFVVAVHSMVDAEPSTGASAESGADSVKHQFTAVEMTVHHAAGPAVLTISHNQRTQHIQAELSNLNLNSLRLINQKDGAETVIVLYSVQQFGLKFSRAGLGTESVEMSMKRFAMTFRQRGLEDPETSTQYFQLAVPNSRSRSLVVMTLSRTELSIHSPEVIMGVVKLPSVFGLKAFSLEDFQITRPDATSTSVTVGLDKIALFNPRGAVETFASIKAAAVDWVDFVAPLVAVGTSTTGWRAMLVSVATAATDMSVTAAVQPFFRGVFLGICDLVAVDDANVAQLGSTIRLLFPEIIKLDVDSHAYHLPTFEASFDGAALTIASTIERSDRTSRSEVSEFLNRVTCRKQDTDQGEVCQRVETALWVRKQTPFKFDASLFVPPVVTIAREFKLMSGDMWPDSKVVIRSTGVGHVAVSVDLVASLVAVKHKEAGDVRLTADTDQAFDETVQGCPQKVPECGYRGAQDVAANGEACESWHCAIRGDCTNHDEILNRIKQRPDHFERLYGVGDHKYCRNVRGSGQDGIFCFTRSGKHLCKPRATPVHEETVSSLTFSGTETAVQYGYASSSVNGLIRLPQAIGLKYKGTTASVLFPDDDLAPQAVFVHFSNDGSTGQRVFLSTAAASTAPTAIRLNVKMTNPTSERLITLGGIQAAGIIVFTPMSLDLRVKLPVTVSMDLTQLSARGSRGDTATTTVAVHGWDGSAWVAKQMPARLKFRTPMQAVVKISDSTKGRLVFNDQEKAVWDALLLVASYTDGVVTARVDTPTKTEFTDKGVLVFRGKTASHHTLNTNFAMATQILKGSFDCTPDLTAAGYHFQMKPQASVALESTPQVAVLHADVTMPTKIHINSLDGHQEYYVSVSDGHNKFRWVEKAVYQDEISFVNMGIKTSPLKFGLASVDRSGRRPVTRAMAKVVFGSFDMSVSNDPSSLRAVFLMPSAVAVDAAKRLVKSKPEEETDVCTFDRSSKALQYELYLPHVVDFIGEPSSKLTMDPPFYVNHVFDLETAHQAQAKIELPTKFNSVSTAGSSYVRVMTADYARMKLSLAGGRLEGPGRPDLYASVNSVNGVMNVIRKVVDARGTVLEQIYELSVADPPELKKLPLLQWRMSASDYTLRFAFFLPRIVKRYDLSKVRRAARDDGWEDQTGARNLFAADKDRSSYCDMTIKMLNTRDRPAIFASFEPFSLKFRFGRPLREHPTSVDDIGRFHTFKMSMVTPDSSYDVEVKNLLVDIVYDVAEGKGSFEIAAGTELGGWVSARLDRSITLTVDKAAKRAHFQLNKLELSAVGLTIVLPTSATLVGSDIDDCARRSPVELPSSGFGLIWGGIVGLVESSLRDPKVITRKICTAMQTVLESLP